MSKDIYGEFYSPVKLISTNKPYLFSLGVRSSGKSTGWLIHLLREFMRDGKQFIYLRRDKEELDATATTTTRIMIEDILSKLKTSCIRRTHIILMVR